MIQFVLWTAVGMSLSKAAASTPAEKALEELLVYRDKWGTPHNMSNLSDGGRRIPWPTVLMEANLTMSRLLGRDARDKDRAMPEPQMTIHAYEGDAIRLPSGVGMWIKPKEVMWSQDRRLMWQHTPDRPDWTDYRQAAKFTIDRNYDLKIKRITPRDEGRYTSRFQIKEGGPIYSMEIELQLHRLPDPKIYTDRTNPSSRRITLKEEEASVDLKCQATGARAGTTLGWTKDGNPNHETDMTAPAEESTLVSITQATREDNGALFTCFTTHNDTKRRKTTTIQVKAKGVSQDKKEPHPVKNEKNATTEKAKNTPEWAVDSIVTFTMAATALAAAAVGSTLAILKQCNNRQYQLAALSN